MTLKEQNIVFVVVIATLGVAFGLAWFLLAILEVSVGILAPGVI